MSVSDMLNTNADINNFFASLPCRVQKPYPSAHIPVKDKNTAEQLYDAFADGGNAEFTAIAQYLNHAMTIKEQEISNITMCIALIEMKHLHLLGTMIETMGGDPRYWRSNHSYWSGGNVNYGSSVCEKISLDILAEDEAIVGYEALLRVIRISEVRSVIERILEDERYHRELFIYLFEKYCCR